MLSSCTRRASRTRDWNSLEWSRVVVHLAVKCTTTLVYIKNEIISVKWSCFDKSINSILSKYHLIKQVNCGRILNLLYRSYFTLIPNIKFSIRNIKFSTENQCFIKWYFDKKTRVAKNKATGMWLEQGKFPIHLQTNLFSDFFRVAKKSGVVESGAPIIIAG